MQNVQARLLSLSLLILAAVVMTLSRDDVIPLIGAILFVLCVVVYVVNYVETYKADRYDETRCRKCGYILRGITEPRCPECGERI